MKTIFYVKTKIITILLVLGFWLSTTPAQLAHAADARLSKEAFAKLSAYKYFPMGNSTAKVTVYEFSSLTCPHCSAFHINVFPKIKEKYINSGKIKWQTVDFPLDNIAFGAAVLARCTPDGKLHNALLDQIFKTQAQWIGAQDPKAGLLSIMARAGINEATANQCLKNKKYLEEVSNGRKLGESIGVAATPSFFVMDRIVENDEKKLMKAIDEAIAQK